ncbi:RING-H2 finger protein ATL2 [Cajanus cajan]|uniref:RING-type E3 ubiquitin transferase n=1 Tax=Cajanus cajan TaxID=3821 RepID=A0A151SK97_CAJCA|nr:RING-H2 finger protein ATL2 [Cajanus cajan]KYP55218.1 RING-H2 finger protein ATL3F [Cajanus cajan]
MAQDRNQSDAFTRRFNQNPNPKPQDFDAKGYSLSGKIMLSAIILLFFVVLVMLCLHIYARWYLRRARRRHLRRIRRTQLVFHNDAVHPAAVPRGLDAAVLASLPVFSYDPKAHPENAPECAVCLSEFEPGEPGRVLPKCNHSFHSECIDMWFHSHDTCPLCRAPVEPPPEPEVVIIIRESEPEPGTGSGPFEGANRSGSSSVGERRKPSLVGVSVEVPPRDESSGFDSPSTQSAFRSPMSRMLSFTRMLSRERKGGVSPSSCGGACSSAAESGAERGGREETQ